MRVNVYAEEMTDQIEIIEKKTDGGVYTGLRIYLHLPVTLARNKLTADFPGGGSVVQVAHHPGDDDSSAVTFWGKRDLRKVLEKAIVALDEHYAAKDRPKQPLEVLQDFAVERKVDLMHPDIDDEVDMALAELYNRMRKGQ